MPILSEARIKEIAAGVISSLLADMIFEFPAIKTAVNKESKGAEWGAFLDEKIESVTETLIRNFGAQ